MFKPDGKPYWRGVSLKDDVVCDFDTYPYALAAARDNGLVIHRRYALADSVGLSGREHLSVGCAWLHRDGCCTFSL